MEKKALFLESGVRSRRADIKSRERDEREKVKRRERGRGGREGRKQDSL